MSTSPGRDRPPVHTFHIPVMGTGFTIDTPLKVARFGISSVVSLVDDVLIERMRRLHSRLAGHHYEEIAADEHDSRARRITSYLDLLDRLVARQVRRLKRARFEPGSEITRYFELLPESPLRRMYERMTSMRDPDARARLERELRAAVVPGRIDVNIMTKLDRDPVKKGVPQTPENSDALSALRGFARSRIRGSVVLSAGMNRRLYSYISKFDDFFPDGRGELTKHIILKVSDLRSAMIQGRFLAKMGLWVTEFRIESGLNCGGHAFATQGHLMGPILDEFRRTRETMAIQLYELYVEALRRAGRRPSAGMPEQRVTAQGGIGTHEEQQLMMTHYGLDGTGWGTPFLLVPDVVNVDDEHVAKLCEADDDDVFLSDASPLGIPFWNLRSSASEEARRARIRRGAPGSSCPKGFLQFNTEFTETPICTASRGYQRRKLKELESEVDASADPTLTEELMLSKSCICHDLAGVAPGADESDVVTPAVCCGPNIVNFHRTCSLDEMVGHIYGRGSVMSNEMRPHMFVREFSLYLDFLRTEIDRRKAGLGGAIRNLLEYGANLREGLEYYRDLVAHGIIPGRERAMEILAALGRELDSLVPPQSREPAVVGG